VASASPILNGMSRPRGAVLRAAAAARWGRVQRAAQAVVTGEHEGRATGGGGAKMPFILPIRNLHEPPQRVALDNIKRAPSEVGGDQIAIGLFMCIFHGDHKAFGFVGADI
jgi:hypothetical protein